MANRLFNVAAALSALAFCLVALAWILAGIVEPRRQHLSFSSRFHLSILARGADARMVIFNDASYGPYRGSIIGIAGNPNNPKVSGVGDVAGVYYRHIRWPDGESLWTLALSLAYPLLLAGVLPVAWLIRRTRLTMPSFPGSGLGTR